jgi:hypothetical protein
MTKQASCIKFYRFHNILPSFLRSDSLCPDIIRSYAKVALGIWKLSLERGLLMVRAIGAYVWDYSDYRESPFAF